jgi:polyhydroxybutyrate depolymerase
MRTSILIWAVAVATAGCGAASEKGETAGAEADLACTAAPLAPGDHAFTIDAGGTTRRYDVHLPPGYDNQTRMPVVVYFHPLLTDKDYLQGVGTRELADAAGFIAVYPEGINTSWNAGSCCGPSNGAGGEPAVDDVAFVRALVAAIDHDACIDRQRIYATGFSNGGFLSHRLACEAADVFAAVAPVSSVNGIAADACHPPRAVPVFTMNGTTDKLVPYAGGIPDENDPVLANIVDKVVAGGGFAGVEQSFREWAERDGCTDAPSVSFTQGGATCLTHSACEAGVEVTQCTLTGAGHCWFGEPMCILGDNSPDMSATHATWEFLRRFRHPGSVALAPSTGGTPVVGMVPGEDSTGGTVGEPTGNSPTGTTGEEQPAPTATLPPNDGPPAAGIDLSGSWALKQLTTQNVMAPLIGMQVSETTTIAVIDIVHTGTTVHAAQTICDMKFSAVAGTTTVWPPAAIAALPVATSEVTVDTVDVGSAYTQSTVGTLGWTTTAPATDALPADAMDMRVVDADKDGHPGVTLSLQGFIAGDVYVVARTATDMMGMLVSADRIEGSQVTRSEQKVVGASNPLLMSDVPSTADPDPAKNAFTMVRLAGTTACGTVMQDAGTLFP